MPEIKQVCSSLAVVSLLLAVGCGSGSSPASSTPITPAQGAHTIYVVQNAVQRGGGADSVLEFSATANGSVSPSATLTGPAGVVFTSVAVDTSGNLYIVSNSPTPEILVYAPGGNGPWTPGRTIAGSLTTLTTPTAVAVDASGQIYVTVDNPLAGSIAILVFAANATGNVAPIQTITSFSMTAPSSIAVSNGSVYVSDLALGVLVFPSSANGPTTPARTISGTATDLVHSFGVGVDAAGDVYATNETPPGWEIMAFAPTANGNAAPTKAIAGSVLIAGVAVDAAGTIYAVAASTGNGALGIEVFGSSANGSVVPTAIISSSAWTGCTMGQIAIN